MIDILQAADSLAALPELALVVAAMALLMVGVYRTKPATDLVTSLSLFVLAGTAALVVYSSSGTVEAFHGAFVVDVFARVMKVMVLFGSAIAITMSVHFMKLERIELRHV